MPIYLLHYLFVYWVPCPRPYARRWEYIPVQNNVPHSCEALNQIVILLIWFECTMPFPYFAHINLLPRMSLCSFYFLLHQLTFCIWQLLAPFKIVPRHILFYLYCSDNLCFNLKRILLSIPCINFLFCIWQVIIRNVQIFAFTLFAFRSCAQNQDWHTITQETSAVLNSPGKEVKIKVLAQDHRTSW